jgi:hypothetical protein
LGEVLKGSATACRVVLFFSMVAFVPVFFFAGVYSQVSLGYDANNAGLYLLLFFAGFAPAAQVGGRILGQRGANHRSWPAAGYGWLRAMGLEVDRFEPRRAWWAILIAGAGIGPSLGPGSSADLAGMPPEARSESRPQWRTISRSPPRRC